MIGAVSKTVVRLWCTVGSNPTPSASKRASAAKTEIRKSKSGTGRVANAVLAFCFRDFRFRPYPGGVPEWTIGHAWRACVPYGYRGFESHPLRQCDKQTNGTNAATARTWKQQSTPPGACVVGITGDIQKRGVEMPRRYRGNRARFFSDLVFCFRCYRERSEASLRRTALLV